MLSHKAIEALRFDESRSGTNSHATDWSPRYARGMREKLDKFVQPALGNVAFGVLRRVEIEDRLLASIVARFRFLDSPAIRKRRQQNM
ncbi:MAG: hypothetical protein WAM11_06240 [Cyanobium sp.]